MNLSIVGIFAAGVLTFFTPCVLPLIPMYLSALVGTNVLGIKYIAKGQMLLKSAAFSAGFIVIFSVLGLGASAVGTFFRDHKVVLLLLAAVIIMVFGLKFLKLIKIPFIEQVLRADASKAADKGGALGAFLMGVVFAAGWSPCAGPVLGSVLTYTASRTHDTLTGGLYLAAYGLGLAAPLLLTAVFAETGIQYIQKAGRFVPVFEKATGVFLVVVASALLFQAASLTLLHTGTEEIAGTTTSRQAENLQALPVMYEFYSEYCEVCKKMEPMIKELKTECSQNQIAIRQVDILAEDGNQLARKLGILAVPTFVFLNAEGFETFRLIGYQTKPDLRKTIAAVSGDTCPGSYNRP